MKNIKSVKEKQNKIVSRRRTNLPFLESHLAMCQLSISVALKNKIKICC